MKCEITGKTQFTKREAHEFINRVSRVGGDRLREYHCPFCNTHHVTKSMERTEPCPRHLLNQPLQHLNEFKKYLND